MAIQVPGEKFRHHRLLSRKKGKREVTALLSLTAMVDMFTVLVIFLLQNYNTEGLIVNIPKDLILPKAEVIKELKPSVVVTVSPEEVLIDEVPIARFEDIKNQKDWMIQPLFVEAQKAIEKAKEKKQISDGVIKDVRKVIKPGEEEELKNMEPWRKVTVQAHKEIDFLSIKKVLYTLTEAGAGEINFAVIQRPQDKAQ